MASNNVKISSSELEVEPVGLNKILGFQGKMSFPLSCVKGATIDEGILSEGKGIKAPGANFPGKSVGTFRKEGEKVFYNITHKEIPVFDGLENEKFDRLVLGVENPKQLVDD